ncbi:MAG: 30S ribosomal protein S8, partial [Chlamydiae bacterium]|nr:30S ribosomal protein S8 [Chlamydiota bacterium]
LKEKGYVAHYLVKELKGKSTIRIFLKYDQERTPIISGLRRVSKPSLRRYVSHKEIPYVLGGIGTVVMSTSRGMMDDKKARHEKVGGEVVAYVW